MKLLALIPAILLTACATGQDAYYNAIAEREKRQADNELRADTAIANMAATGDAQAKGMGLMYFALKAQNKGQTMIAAPKSVAEQALPWLSLLLPEARMAYQSWISSDVQKHQSDNSLAGKKADNDMITDLVQGRKTPIIGDSNDVLLYGN